MDGRFPETSSREPGIQGDLMLDWLGAEGAVIADAFERVFRRQGTSFGSPALQWGGVHDGSAGVQWNVGLDPRRLERWASMNLEGPKYSGVRRKS